jgi:hypothetical protein
MKQIQNLSRRPFFWIIQIFGFTICTYLAVLLYPKAFPIIDLEIKMDRLNALKSAQTLAQKHHWGPSQFRQTASFDLDNQTQTFIELSAGGSTAFSKVLKAGIYSPYTWKVRHFAEGQTNETLIRFTPNGEFYGFHENLAESLSGPALSATEALKIAETSAGSEWGVNLSAYKLVEKSQEAQPSHRIDHTFVYERTQETIGEGRYRLKLVVSGDRLSELRHFVKIPNAFLRQYAEMRSANDTISALSSVAMAVLYLLGGCGLGIFFLARKHWLIWKTPILFGVGVAFFQLLEQVNQLPLAWMSYDTALSSMGFLFRNSAFAGIHFLMECVLLTISFMAAESLSRKAFPHQPQFWHIWYPQNASSRQILGRTLGGYLSVGFFFLLVVLTYIAGTQFFGWWSPSDTLFQPDGLATYCPWFTSIANSLHAGFWEESLFRAVPLAGAALLGDRFGRRKLWITAGFIVQAVIFAAAHANYPAQPSYARVVELIIPSLMFGGIYLVYGLLPGIILHFTFDVVSFAIPLFAMSNSRIWADRVLVILFALLPLWVVLLARWKNKRWVDLNPKELNGGWIPAQPRKSEKKTLKHHKLGVLNRKSVFALSVLSAIGVLVWASLIPFKNDAPSVDIRRQEAIEISKKALLEHGIHLSSEWQPLASPTTGIGEEDRFIWKTEGPQKYKELIGSYIAPPAWIVRFVRFDTPVAERAEEFQVFIAKAGDVYRIRHELPEGRSGAALDQDKARKVADAALQKNYNIQANHLKEVSSNSFQLPQRRDWLFIYSNPAVQLKTGEARIGVKVAGDQDVASRKFIFIPEEWSRNERNQENVMNILRIFCTLLIFLIFFGGVVYALVNWTKKNFDTHSFRISFILLSLLGIANFLNNIPSHLASFSTVEPKLNQMTTLVAFNLVKILFLSACSSLIVGLIHQRVRHTPKIQKSTQLAIGYSVGILVTLGVALVSQLLPSPLPRWGNLTGLDEAIPLLSGLELVEKYVWMTLIFSLIEIWVQQLTFHWTRRVPGGFLFLFAVGLAVTGIDVFDFPRWILWGCTAGICFILAYRFLIRSSLSMIPLATASAIILLEWKQIAMHPYVGSTINGIISILLVLIASLLWHQQLERITLAEKV